MTTEEWLYNKYGNSPLLSFTQVAEILHRALLRKRIIHFICYFSNGNKPIKALSLGR